MKEELSYDDVYCSLCGACGEEGCCPGDMCEGKGGLYCDHYNNIKREQEQDQEEYYLQMCKKYKLKP